MKRLVTLAIIITGNSLLAQTNGGVKIGPNGDQAHPSAAFEVEATDKGALLPRMTKIQMEAISSPEEGLLVYVTDSEDRGYYVFEDGSWRVLGNWHVESGVARFDGNVGINTSSAPKEALQIGDEFVIHQGGTTVVGRNFHYDGSANRKLVDGTSVIMRFEGESNGGLSFESSSGGSANANMSDGAGTDDLMDLMILNNNGKLEINPTREIYSTRGEKEGVHLYNRQLVMDMEVRTGEAPTDGGILLRCKSDIEPAKLFVYKAPATSTNVVQVQDLSLFHIGSDLDVQGTITSSSDSTLKRDILPLTNSLDKVRQLNGVTYYWKQGVDNFNRDNDQHMGLIAQEVQAQFPNSVKENVHGKLSVEYTSLIAPLIEAIKEQQQIIEDLQARVQELESN